MKMFIFGALFGVNLLGMFIQLIAGRGKRDLLIVHGLVVGIAFGAAVLS